MSFNSFLINGLFYLALPFSKILIIYPVKVKLAQLMPRALLGARGIAVLIVTLGSSWR